MSEQNLKPGRLAKQLLTQLAIGFGREPTKFNYGEFDECSCISFGKS
jgi:hypothetical protein